VQILEHEHGWSPRRKLADQCRGDRVRFRRFVDNVMQLASDSLGDIDERPERPRRKQRVAFAPQNARRLALLGAEPSQQRRLADPASPVMVTSRPRAVRATS
jgi:hypothetical protein